MTKLDQFTLTTVPLEQYFNNTFLGHGTGFVWKAKERHYLVTNWHVFSMKDFDGKNLRDDAGRPNIVRTLFNVRAGSFDKVHWNIQIRDDDDQPLWLSHPTKRVDIAVMPIATFPGDAAITLYPLNVLANDPLRVEIGMDVFILGYPFKVELPAYPIWKRGSIASEPDLAPLTTNYFYVDTASRPGMSGAPVLRRSWGTHMLEPDIVSTGPQRKTKFIGVYSGRVPTDHPHEAQIGLVWQASLIDEIIALNVRDI